MVIFSWLRQANRWLTVSPCRHGQGESVSMFHPYVWSHVDLGVPAPPLASPRRPHLRGVSRHPTPWQHPRISALRPTCGKNVALACISSPGPLCPHTISHPCSQPRILQRPRSSAHAPCPATHTSFGNEGPVSWRQSPHDPLVFFKSLVFLNQKSNVDPFTSTEGKKKTKKCL